MSEANALIKLQEIDLEVLRLRKRLEGMPQIEALRKVKAKIAEVSEKSKQISAMRSECELEMQRLVDEDEALVEKSGQLQAKIDENDDFRSVTNLTRELEGVAKRRNKVEFDHGKLAERIDKISSVEDQVADALAKLEGQQTRFESEISAAIEEINAKLAEHKIAHDQALADVSAERAELYERLKGTKNGIAVGILAKGHCSACMVGFPEGKLVQLMAGPDVTTCPQCHRILVIDRSPDDADE